MSAGGVEGFLEVVMSDVARVTALAADRLERFQAFFEDCVGAWSAERTYHYLNHGDVERSHTNFQIQPVEIASKQQVLADNRYGDRPDLAEIPGYHLDFQTVSEKGDRVEKSLNFLFIPTSQTALGSDSEPPIETVPDHLLDGRAGYLAGDYLRDYAYEETRPVIANFRFDFDRRELRMITTYSRVVSVDSITLVHPRLRLRRILNYRRPEQPGDRLETIVLAGFGVEEKV